MQRLIIAIMLVLMVAPSPSREAESPPLGSFWMDPIKEFRSKDPFSLWFRPKEEGFVHFCLSRQARWTKIGGSGFHLSVGGLIHYWVHLEDTEEVTFEGYLPSTIGEVTLVHVGHNVQRCGSQDVTIKILTRGE